MISDPPVSWCFSTGTLSSFRFFACCAPDQTPSSSSTRRPPVVVKQGYETFWMRRYPLVVWSSTPMNVDRIGSSSMADTRESRNTCSTRYMKVWLSSFAFACTDVSPP